MDWAKVMGGLFIVVGALFAQNRVYFSPDTPFLGRVSRILTENSYRMYEDSSDVDWYGRLDQTPEEDSVRVAVVLEGRGGTRRRTIGVFAVPRLSNAGIVAEWKHFLAWIIPLNVIFAGLFFIRSG